MNFRDKKIRVLVLGDNNVGKTSLISSLVDSFPDQPPRILEQKVLPPVMHLHSHEVTTVFVDSLQRVTIADAENEEKTNEEIKEANVIVLAYDITSKQTADSINDNWLPKVTKYNPKVPIIILACKLDLAKKPNAREVVKIVDIIKILMKNSKQVEIGFECSALSGKNLGDLVSCIHKVGLFPLSPLYDTRQRIMKDEFKKALKCIFRICDVDCDGRLSDTELKSFQLDVFRGELSNKDIRGIKEVIREEVDDPQINLGIDLKGFMALQQKCIELMKIQTCWTILRHFGFDDNLKLSEEIFKDSIALDDCKSQSVELNSRAIKFLIQIYQLHAKENLLDYAGILEIFDPFGTIPWPNLGDVVRSKIKDNSICIDFHSWMSLWQYVGFVGSLEETFLKTNNKRTLKEFNKIHNRQVIHALVIGSDGVGKSKLLDSIIKKSYSDIHIPSPSSRSIVVEDTYNEEPKNIIFTEVPSSNLAAELESNDLISKVDLVLILFDELGNASTFLEKYIRSIPDTLPRLLVRTKVDTGIKKRKFESLSVLAKLDSSEYNNIPNISCKDGQLNELQKAIEEFIMTPSKFIPNSALEVLKSKNKIWDNNWSLVTLGVVGVAAILLMIKYKNKINLLSIFKKR